MSEVEKHSKPLTTLQTQIAMLDAQGLGPLEISRALGCHEKTVTHLRREDWYQAERQRWIELNINRLEPIINRLKAQAVGAHEKAITELVDQLSAEDAEGRPLRPVRAKAAEIIINSPIIRGLVGVTKDEAQAVAAAVTTVNLTVTRERLPTDDKVIIIDQEEDEEDVTEED